MCNSSIFRTKKKPIPFEDIPFRKSKNINIITHDSSYPRAREYSLSCKLYFSEYSGLTIQDLILTDFDYFLWFPRKINGFTYRKDVIDYAKKCLKTLIIIDEYSNKTMSRLGKQIEQVELMAMYEYTLDYEDNVHLLKAYKQMINVECYKSIPKPLLMLIRQTIDGNMLNLSNEKRREFLNNIS